MNTWLSWWHADERATLALRALLRRGTRLSHYLFSIVGGCAVLLALALWLLPSWRGTLAARVMPFVSAAVQAGPARLLQGNPLPSVTPPADTLSEDAFSSNENANGVTPTAALAQVATAAANSASSAAPAVGSAPLNGLAPQTLPSVSTLARMIPSDRITPDARDDRVLVSAREQALVATYIARRYHVAQEPVGELVKAAFQTGREVGLDPLLLLAVMAIESSFNPYAESGVGAQGLMQVMAKVHSDKLQYFGGQSAALDPLANITVGALVLKDCIARGGTLVGGLRLYNGATSDDGGYGAKVMAERGRLRAAAQGREVPVTAPQGRTTTVSAPVPQHTAAHRVQVTLGGAHPLAEKTAAAPAKQPEEPEQDDANANTTKHASASDMGV
jgi:soluble lytic murein transglycosylase-like protein